MKLLWIWLWKVFEEEHRLVGVRDQREREERICRLLRMRFGGGKGMRGGW